MVLARLAALALGALWANAAEACAVCFTATERNRLAFFSTTIFLSLLPLGLIAAGLWYLARHAKDRLQDEFMDRDEVVVGSGAEPRAKETHA